AITVPRMSLSTGLKKAINVPLTWRTKPGKSLRSAKGKGEVMDNSKTAPGNKATSQIREQFKDTDFLQPLTYTLQDCGGWYARDADPASEHGGHLLKIPATLHIQHVYKQGIKSNQVLTSGNDQDHQQFFTGLRQTSEQD